MAKSHKNRNSRTSSYARTFCSTKNLLTEELEKVKPVQKTIFNAHESEGGFQKSQSIGALPWGGNLALYLRRKQSSAYDDLFYCIRQAMTNYAEYGGIHPFVH